MVDDSTNFAAQVSLVEVEDVVVNEGHFLNRAGVGVLLPEFVVEVEITVGDLRVGEVLHNLQVAEKVLAPAVDHGRPVLAQLYGVVVGEYQGADG